MAFYLLSQITIQLFRSVLCVLSLQVASQSNDEKAITILENYILQTNCPGLHDYTIILNPTRPVC